MKSPHTAITTYDLNYLLKLANVFICGLIIYLYYITDDIPYINIVTLVLVCLFAVENIGMLSYEKRRRNPFILILVLLMTLFYMARIATIIYLPISTAMMQKVAITTEDLNYALIFILLSNASMFLGFHIGSKTNVVHKNMVYVDTSAPKVRNVLILVFLLVLVHNLGVLSFETIDRLSRYIQTYFFNQLTIILFTFSFLVYHYNRISSESRTIVVITFSAIIILITLSGRRSGFLTMGYLMMISILVVKQRIMISRKQILIIIMIIPIAVIFFITATFKRQLGISTNDQFTVEYINTIKEHNVFSANRVEIYLAELFYRMGYLDWSTELIANREKFAKLINGQYYLESIIDNVLTPGFDVFDKTRSSVAMKYIRNEQSIPDKEQIASEYQSEQMGIYGEYYVLFYGYLALAVFFFIAFIFQRAFVAFKGKSGLAPYLYGAVLLNLFYIWMNSYGMDWFALDIVGALITTFLFARYYKSSGRQKVVLMIESNQGCGRKRLMYCSSNNSKL